MPRSREEERTGFQESAPFHPDYDLQTDFVMVYGIDDTMPARIQQWKARGYVVHLMTGIAWGDYHAYLDGAFDGRTHWDEAQTDRYGKMILHGEQPPVPYMVPTLSMGQYLASRIRLAVDAGVTAIHLEEPEFWVNGGYSDAFKREWQMYYKEPWQAPHTSAEAQYRASKLKAYLYTRVLDRLCSEMKDYALRTYNSNLRFYVPTHSLINYTQWRIVSPQSQLIELPGVDGYIAQIWTGTARTPNVYAGKRQERTFETAFLEYGVMQELVRGTDRRMWFLHDPIEDNPRHTWSDYRQNYFKTVVASLLHPGVSHYEVSPWPRRIFQGLYPAENGQGKEGIPPDYATTLLQLMHTLGHMEQSDVQMDNEPLQVGLLIADSAMYQRMKLEKGAAEPGKYDGTDPIGYQIRGDTELLDFSVFYGLALPLLKHGVPVRPVQLDNVMRYPAYLTTYRVLVLSYEFMKPEHPGLHDALAGWVRNGGVLVYVGDDRDPYHGIRHWWNDYQPQEEVDSGRISPRSHLFAQFGLRDEREGLHRIGKGALYWIAAQPADFAESSEAADRLREAVKSAVSAVDESEEAWKPKHYYHLRRGPYTIIYVLDESVSVAPLVVQGPVVDLFDPRLPVLEQVTIQPGTPALLYDLTHGQGGIGAARVIAASSRIEDWEDMKDGMRWTAQGPDHLQARARLYCPQAPHLVTGRTKDKSDQPVLLEHEWDAASGTLLIAYTHGADCAIEIEIRWQC